MTSAIRGVTHEKDGLVAFALDIYSNAAVQRSCLLLQERQGADVNLILWAAWLSTRQGMPPGRDAVLYAKAQISEWHGLVVTGLRAVRRALKQESLSALSAKAELVRNAVKKIEIDAEIIELEALEVLDADHLASLPALRGSCPEQSIWLAACSGNDAEPDADESEAVAVIAAAGRIRA